MERAARRDTAVDLDDRQVARDDQPDEVKDGEDDRRVDAQQLARRDPARHHWLVAVPGNGAGDAPAAAAWIASPSAWTVTGPVYATPFKTMVGVWLMPLATA